MRKTREGTFTEYLLYSRNYEQYFYTCDQIYSLILNEETNRLRKVKVTRVSL